MSAWTDQLAALQTAGTAIESALTSAQAAALQAQTERDQAKTALAAAQEKIVELQAALDATVPPAVPSKTVTAEDRGNGVVRVRWQGLTPMELGRIGPPVYEAGGWNTASAPDVLAKALTDGFIDFSEATVGVEWEVYAKDASGTYSTKATPTGTAPPAADPDLVIAVDAAGEGGDLR